MRIIYVTYYVYIINIALNLLLLSFTFTFAEYNFPVQIFYMRAALPRYSYLAKRR